MIINKRFFMKAGLLFLLIFVSASYFLSLQSGSLIFFNEYSKDAEYDTVFQKTSIKDLKYNANISVWELASLKTTNEYALYLPGNGGLMEDIFINLSNEFNVIGVAYPGYHESESEPTPENTLSAVDTVYNWMIYEKNIDPSNITIVGHSLGGAPAAYLAGKYNNAKQLVLINTFSSVQSMCVRSFYILCGFTGGIFNTAAYAEQVTIPVKVFHYIDDDTIPFTEGEKLFTYFTNTQNKEFIDMEQYSHNELDYELILIKIDN